jgi:hypothetical protein
MFFNRSAKGKSRMEAEPVSPSACTTQFKSSEKLFVSNRVEDAYVGLARAVAAAGRADEAMKVYQKALGLLKAKNIQAKLQGQGFLEAIHDSCFLRA